MILKIIAENGTHFRDGVFNVAVWDDDKKAKYIGKVPFGDYTTDEVKDVRCHPDFMFSDTVIPYCWPENEEELEGHAEITVKHISYQKSENLREQIELYVGLGCTVYLMSDEGKTIERLV